MAEFFNKQHKNVLRDIEMIVGSMLNSEHTPWFIETARVNEQNGQSYRSFDMTRDGFTVLAMGFTGAKAMEFKVAYIHEFNRMEAAMKEAQVVLPDFTDPIAAAQA